MSHLYVSIAKLLRFRSMCPGGHLEPSLCVSRLLRIFELGGPPVARPLEGAKQGHIFGRRACALTQGSGGRLPPAAGGGPQPITDEGMRYGHWPECGRERAGLNALRGKVEDRDFTAARKILHSGAILTSQLQAPADLTDRRAASPRCQP